MAHEVANAVAYLRASEAVVKKPSIAETLDWMSALTAIGAHSLDRESAGKTMGFVLKEQEDIEAMSEDDGFEKLLRR